MLSNRAILAALACLMLVAAVRGDCGEYKEGQSFRSGPPETCAEYVCKNGSMKGKTCSPVFAPNSKCKVKPVAAGAKFPDCCPTIQCP